MRRLLIAVLLITLLVVVGWLSFQYDGRKASVNFDTQEMKRDTSELISKGEQAVDAAARKSKELVNEASEPRESR